MRINFVASASQSEDLIKALQAEIQQLKIALEARDNTIADLQADVEGAETERNFYFDKLRSIEMMFQDNDSTSRLEGNELSAAVLKILYATAEGFDVIPHDEDGMHDEDHDGNQETY